jgi:hypothetical protein
MTLRMQSDDEVTGLHAPIDLIRKSIDTIKNDGTFKVHFLNMIPMRAFSEAGRSERDSDLGVFDDDMFDVCHNPTA